jgi:hypothetical protein
MTTRAKPINDYQQLASRFAVVRRAWKRAAALSGLAVVATESIGIFTALLFLDWLYQPLPSIRIGMWVLALGGIVYLLLRHVVKPLGRKITDDQIALYIEEHRQELDGVLITAAEFGRKRDQSSPNQAALIDAVVHEAAARSAKTHVSKVVDLSRLRKYGIGAIIGVGVYLILSVLFPNSIGSHIGRVLEPWLVTEQDKVKHAAVSAAAEPLRIALSKQNTSMPRGASFDFEATLSKPKPADEGVALYFRPKAGGDWKKLAMTELEKLNAFQGNLPDVSEDLEFYVACGDVKSATYQLSVFDPLVVRSLEVTTHYPDYVKQPDRVEKPSPGDVTALVGSKVTLRILTSTALKDGQIKWSNGQTQPITVDAQANSNAVVSFEVKEDDTYDYTITDINGQQAVSAAPLSVHAIPDTPPTVTVNSPQSPVLTQPVGEVNFDVSAGDDFGVEGLDLVYSRIDAKGNQNDVRIPLTQAPADPKDPTHTITGTYRLALEDANPPFQPNDAIPYHVEARDAKGQVASSSIGLIIIGYFEHWGTWATPETGSEMHNETGADLMQILALVWEVDNQKTQIKPEVVQKRSTEIAGKIEAPDGTLNDFLNLHEHPQLAKVADLINGHIKKSHDALVTADTSSALNQLSIAAAIMAGNGIKLDAVIHGNEEHSMMVGSHTASPAITMLEQARLTALSNAANANKHTEEDEEATAAAAAMAKAAADLLAKQDALVAHAQDLANAQNPGSQKSGSNANDKNKSQSFGSAPATGAGSQPKPGDAEIAAQQHGLAEQTRAAAAAAQGQGAAGNSKLKGAADKTAAAAKSMEEAARAFAQGDRILGQEKATEAKTTLQEVNASLQNSDRDHLEAAITDAARQASVLLEKQRDLGTQTQALAKDLGANKPDQRQQRDLQKQAYQQTVLGADAEALNNVIAALNQKAEEVGQPEAIRTLSDAQEAVKRGQPQVKMSNAVIDLNTASPSAADGEQQNAEASLQRIVDSLQAGSDALAASREAQLNRANRAAQEAKKALTAMGGKASGTETGTQTGQQPGTQAGTQSGTQSGSQPGTQAGTQPGTQAGTQPGTQAGQQPGEQSTAPGNNSGGGDDIRNLAYNLNQLTAAVDNRDLVPQDEAEQLKQMTMDKSELEKKLAVDPKFLQDVTGIVGRISDKIEAEIAAKSAAGKLYSSQREECPPNYRQFVNKYFEVLSQGAPAPGQTTPAEQPAQP